VVATICKRCGRMSGDRIVHDDLYHPMPRRREPEPIAPADADGPTEPGPGTPETDAALLGG
jgi:hypothetical protein